MGAEAEDEDAAAVVALLTAGVAQDVARGWKAADVAEAALKAAAVVVAEAEAEAAAQDPLRRRASLRGDRLR